MPSLSVLVRSKDKRGWVYARTGQRVPHDAFVELPPRIEVLRAINAGDLERKVRHDPSAKPAPKPAAKAEARPEPKPEAKAEPAKEVPEASEQPRTRKRDDKDDKKS